ncbi:polysaccharide biosynthesis protein [Thalassiella azotivora]
MSGRHSRHDQPVQVPGPDHPDLPALLLGRDPNPAPGRAALETVRGRRVLVTGAGGVVGRALVQALTRARARSVHLLDHDASALHALQLQLEGHDLVDDDRFVLADVRDRGRVERVMAAVRPDVVLHAAGQSRLRLVQRHPVEGVRTNVLGTANVVAAAVTAGVECVVKVGSDEAARPSSVLGATERLAEAVLAAHAGRGTRVATARVGTVVGGTGCPLHVVAHQVRSGHEVTVVDERATRRYSTLQDAVCLVLEAAAMADAGEVYAAATDPLPVAELVRRHLDAGGAPDTPVVVTGLRPGEKLHADVADGADRVSPSARPGVLRLDGQAPAARDLLARADALGAWCGTGDDRAVVEALTALLPPGSGEPTSLRDVDLRDADRAGGRLVLS